MLIAAQVSLYPLHRESLSPAIDTAVSIFKEHGLEVVEGTMSTQVYGEDRPIFNALQDTFKAGASQGDVVMVVTFSNGCPVKP